MINLSCESNQARMVKSLATVLVLGSFDVGGNVFDKERKTSTNNQAIT
jgi:hypothetical protein